MKIGAPTTAALLAELRREGRSPYVLPFGGSDPLGTIGYVNAAFELRAQIDEGVLPEPDRIYVPLGSLGTAAGLLIGLRAAGLRGKLLAVRVVDAEEAPAERLRSLVDATVALLRRHAPSFPAVELRDDHWELRGELAGRGYGVFTPEGAHAARWLWELERRALDGCYTSKAFAALLADAPKHPGEHFLFWDTADAILPAVELVDGAALPAPLHDCFADPLQPLDSSFHLSGEG